MSFFLVSVPQGTKLYYGTSSPDTLVNIGWVAFDPEHASVFARPSRRQHHHANDLNDPQKAIKTTGSMDADLDHTGWLHTYQAAMELRLIYIDGMSAGKSQIGTLDSQGRILFNDSIPSGGVSQETQRAITVCRIAEKE